MTYAPALRAHALGKGSWEFGLETSVQASTNQDCISCKAPPPPGIHPHVDAVARYGLVDGVNVAARVGQSGVTAEVLWQFLGSGSDRLAAAVAPRVGGMYSLGLLQINVSSVHVAVPLLLGWQISDRARLVLGLSAFWWLFTEGSASGSVTGRYSTPGIGFSLAVGIRAGGNAWLTPWLAVVAPIGATGWQSDTPPVTLQLDVTRVVVGVQVGISGSYSVDGS